MSVHLVNGWDGTNRVFGIRHSVEGTQCHREFVDDIVVDVVLGLNNPSKAFLVLGALQSYKLDPLSTD